MSAVCTTTNLCINAVAGDRPPRAAYINLHNLTDSEGEIVKSAAPRARRGVPVADGGVSCRQMYLRSYKFTTKESVPERTRRCLGEVKEKLGRRRKRRRNLNRNRNRKGLIWRKVKEFSSSLIMFGNFRRILSCAASVDVVEQKSER